jgi:hypothetical protein
MIERADRAVKGAMRSSAAKTQQRRKQERRDFVGALVRGLIASASAEGSDLALAVSLQGPAPIPLVTTVTQFLSAVLVRFAVQT